MQTPSDGKLAYDDRRLLVEYLKACDNEIAVDRLVFARSGASPDRLGYIPRPSIWLDRLSRSPFLSRQLFRYAWLAWAATLGLPFHLLIALRQFSIASRDGRPHLDADELVGIAFTDRAMDVIGADGTPRPAKWIIPSWIDASAGIAPENRIPVSAFLDRRTVLRALRLSRLAVRAFLHRKSRSHWLLQTYTAMQWFVMRLALAEIENDRAMAEHFDRWAVLADVATRDTRRRNEPSEPGARLYVVQHGLVGRLGSDQSLRVEPAYRLSAVNGLYVYDEQSAQVFCEEILTRNCAAKVEVSRFNPLVTLTELDDAPAGTIRLLFVGHPLCAHLQMAVLEQIHGKSLHVYYKPHPSAGQAKVARDIGWTVVRERRLFPDVDVVVSYRSTLATEYEQHGKVVVIHDLTNDVAMSNDVSREVLAAVETAKQNSGRVR